MQDEEILALFALRNEQAIQALQEKYGALCRTVAMQILGSPQDAEECVSDMLYQVWNAVPPEKPEKLAAYCAALTRNTALNRYRSQHTLRRGSGETPLVLEELSDCIPAENRTDQILDRIALTDSLTRFLRGESAKNRKVFLLRYFSMLSVSQIADETSLNENTVKSILKRTRDALRVQLEKEGLL